MSTLFPIILLILVSVAISQHTSLDSSNSICTILLEKIAVGLILIAYIFLTLGLFHILYWWSFASCLAIMCIVSVVIKLRRVKQSEWSVVLKNLKTIKTLWLVCIAGLIFSPAIINALGPVVGYDANSYHLPIPYYYLYFLHSLDLEYLLPNNGLLPGTFGLTGFLALFGNPQASSMLTVFFSLSSYIFLVSKTKKLLLPSLLFALLSSILSFETSSQPGNDFALVFFTLILVNSLLSNKWRNVSNKQFTLISLMIGYLPLIKAFAFPLSLLLLSYLIYINQRVTIKIKLFGAFLSLFPVTLFLFFNILNFSNPLHPSFSSIFPDRYILSSAMSEVEYVTTTLPNDLKSLFTYPSLFSQANIQFFFQVITVLLFAIALFLNILKKNRVSENQINIYIFGSLWVILVAEILIIGNFLRYFMFLIVPLYGFMMQTGNSSHEKSSRISRNQVKHSRMQKYFYKLNTSILLILFMVSLSSSSYFNWKPEIRSEETISTLKQFITPRDTICLLGDHRAFLFFPNKVFVFPTNEIRNPFHNRNSFDIEVIESEIWGKCSLFLLKEDWGFPPETSIEIIEAFKEVNSPIFSEAGWLLFKQRR